MKRGKRPLGLAIAAAVILIAGCGGTKLVAGSAPSVAVPSDKPAVASAVKVGNVYSASYCWHLNTGEWVTGAPNSTTACVPDPTYATGNEQDDASVPLPRCYTCTLADWTRAEAHAAASLQASNRDGATTTEQKWPPSVRSRFISACATNAPKAECGCIANVLGRQIPADQFNDGDTSIDDPRVSAAITTCKSAEN